MDRNKKKHIIISKESWKMLRRIKDEYEYSSIQEVIDDMFNTIDLDDVLREIKKRKMLSDDEDEE